MFLRLTHVTRYTYSTGVTFAPHALYLRPRETSRQRLHSFALTISPPARRIATTDPLDNALDWAYFDAALPVNALEFRSELLVETLDTNPFDFFLTPSALSFPFGYNAAEAVALAPCLALRPDSAGAPLHDWLARNLPVRPSDTVACLGALNSAVFRSLRYTRRDEEGIQSAGDTIARGSGSCRDYAVLLIELCRTLGLAARFVSGYLYEAPLPGQPVSPPAMHAWAEVYLPGGGWRGLDATRGIFCDDAFVAVAHAAVAESVNPIQGAIFAPPGTTSSLHTHLTIDRL